MHALRAITARHNNGPVKPGRATDACPSPAPPATGSPAPVRLRSVACLTSHDSTRGPHSLSDEGRRRQQKSTTAHSGPVCRSWACAPSFPPWRHRRMGLAVRSGRRARSGPPRGETALRYGGGHGAHVRVVCAARLAVVHGPPVRAPPRPARPGPHLYEHASMHARMCVAPSQGETKAALAGGRGSVRACATHADLAQ